MAEVPSEEVANCLFNLGLWHGEFGTGGGIVVILAYHQLSHIAGGELCAQPTESQQVATPSRHGQQRVG